MKNLFAIAIAFMCANSANAKEYLGFNLCGKMTEAQIAKVTDKPLTLKEGQISDIKIFEISEYPVGKDFLDVEVKTFKDLVVEIEIDTSKVRGYPHPDVIIENKYGILAERKSTYGFQQVISYSYNTKASDPNLDLTFNIRFPKLVGETIFHGKQYITYLCKPVAANSNQAIKASEVRKLKEAEGKTKF